MAECECLQGCPFFNDRMQNMPALANIMKKRYCMNDFGSCARHMIFEKLGKEAVPSDLYPNQADKAREILAAAGV